MKNIFTSLFLLIGLNVFSQINVDSIGLYMFEMHNELRVKNGAEKRYMSKYCKQASKTHLDYLVKYGFSEGHSESKVIVGAKVLKNPIDRYNNFNKDSVKYVELDYVSYYKPYKYDGEICTYQGMDVDVNNKNINKIIAQTLLQNFINSSPHNYQLINNLFNTKIVRGYFSVNYKIENGVYIFYSVAVFDRSFNYKLDLETFYKQNYGITY
jgi:uncharacterized protein YkwD